MTTADETQIIDVDQLFAVCELLFCLGLGAQTRHRYFQALLAIQQVQQDDSALFPFVIGENRLEILERAISNLDVFASLEIYVDAILFTVGSMSAQRVNQLVIYRKRLLAEGDDPQHATGGTNRPPVAGHTIQVNEEVVRKQWLIEPDQFTTTLFLHFQHWVEDRIILVGEML